MNEKRDRQRVSEQLGYDAVTPEERTNEAKDKVTMNDIARTAGVSQATVSLVLNQSRNIKLSDDTRQRVISVATELGYDRLPAIHAPRNQEEIALLVSSLQSFDPFIDAISRRGKPRGATKRC